MQNLKYFVILITVLNYSRLIQSDDLLELSCLNEAECKQFQHSGIKAACNGAQCQCVTSTGESVECQPLSPKMSNFIGGVCPCTQPNAECNEEQDVCYCARDFVPSRYKRRCIAKIVALREKCEQDFQCQATDYNAICHDSKECRCMKQFVEIDGNCLSIVGTKSLPLNDSLCQEQYGANAKYNDKTQQCICKAGHYASSDNSHCLKIAKYLENCTENLQCIGSMGQGGECVQNVCQCSAKYFAEEKKANGSQSGPTVIRCAAIVEPGHYCRLDSDCYQRQLSAADQSMNCSYGECNCKLGFYLHNEQGCIRSGGSRAKSFRGLQLAFVTLFLLNKFINIFFQ